MEPEIKPIKGTSADFQLNDIGFRLVLIPFFGIVIPLVTGMVDSTNFSNWQIKASFLYTILIAFLVWQGNRYLLFTLRVYFNWFNKPIKKIVALLLAVSFYTIPVSVLLLAGWYHLFEEGIIDWDVVSTATLIIMICVIFITHVYETVFLVRDSESEIVRNAQLQQANAEAELEALKNQIDPHFIFNSLNTLSYLIEEDPVKAKSFNDNLADVYRYILLNKSRNLVLLGEELNFLNDYFYLMHLRFSEAVKLKVLIGENNFDDYLVPPISLQLLLENAIKHNEFDKFKPLIVEVKLEEELIVSNNVCHKTVQKESSRIGLENLNRRYKLVAGNKIRVEESKSLFVVRLPLIKTLG